MRFDFYGSFIRDTRLLSFPFTNNYRPIKNTYSLEITENKPRLRSYGTLNFRKTKNLLFFFFFFYKRKRSAILFSDIRVINESLKRPSTDEIKN